MNEKEQQKLAVEERKEGIRLAKEQGAVKTLEAIKNPDVCYDAILRTAANEIGADKLVSILKEQNSFWAQNAIMHLNDLGPEHVKSLSKNATKNLGKANGLSLHLVAGIAYIGWMTMFWRNPGDPYTLPNAATPKRGNWKWSPEMSASVNNSEGRNCSYYAIDNAPVKPGATCWMVISIQEGRQWELTQYSFTYDPDSPYHLSVESWGAFKSPKFDGKLKHS